MLTADGPRAGRRCATRRLSAMLEVALVRLDPDLPLPAYAKPGDAGLDLVARERVTIAAGGGRALVPTGVAVAIPQGYAGFVQPRSGLALRHGVTCLNTPGLIDSGYRGELKVLLINTDPTDGPPDRAAATASPSWWCSGSSTSVFEVVDALARRQRARRRRLRPHRPLIRTGAGPGPASAPAAPGGRPATGSTAAAASRPATRLAAGAGAAAAGLVGGGGMLGVHVLPAGRQARRGQRGRLGERPVAEVEAVEEVVGVGVAAGQRAEVELGLDEAQHRRVVVHHVRDVVAPWRRAR